MDKEDIKWVIGIAIGLFLGGAVTYTTLITDDALVKLKVDQLEECSNQIQKDINIFKVELSKISSRTEFQLNSSNEAISALTISLKNNTESNNQLAIAIARLQERQAKTDQILDKLVKRIETRGK